MHRTNPSADRAECAHPPCTAPPIPDSPVPLCVRHLGKAYEFARGLLEAHGDLVGLNGIKGPISPEQAQVLTRMFESPKPAHHGQPRWVVYYVRFGDRVKIGYTGNLKCRLQAIPHDEVLATEPGHRGLEMKRHRQFNELRLTGEWFRYVDPLVSHIAALQATA